MKPVVMRSIEDETGARCVDLLWWRTKDQTAAWGYVECRRDPEDAHGWRHLGAPVAGFADQTAAHRAADLATGWMPPPPPVQIGQP